MKVFVVIKRTAMLSAGDCLESLGVFSRIEDAREAASDVSSIDGVSHLYINKCGRLKHKDTKVILFGSYYEGEL